MWGQLAGRISKIGDVVAPALSNDEEDDEEDEDYEDEGEEDEEDEGEYEEEGDEDEEENGSKPVVGFVGFLTRALDGAKHSSTPNKSHQKDSHQAFEHQQEDQEEEEEEEDVIDLDQQHSMQNSLFPHQLQQQQQHQQSQQSSALSSTSNADEDLVLIPAAKDIVASMTASPIPAKSALNVESTTNTELKKEDVGPPPSSGAKRPMQLRVLPSTKPDSAKPTVTNTSQQPKLSAARTTQQQQGKPLSAKRLVVPSVATSTKLPSVVGSNQAPQVEVSALDSDEKGTSQSEENMENVSSFDDSIGQSQRQKPTPSAIRVSEIKEDVPREQTETSLKEQTSGKSSSHPSAKDVENNSNLDEFKGLTRVDHKRTAQNVTNGSALPQAGVEEIVTAPTKSSDTNTPPPMESKAMEQPIAETAKKPAAVSEPSSNDGSIIKPTLTLKQVDDSESSKSTSRVTDSAQEYAKLDVDSPPHMAATDNGDSLSDELARWQAHCQQLESQLQQAQDKLLQSEQLVWEKEQQSEQQRQELLIKFQEKEMRLLEAANEDHQQELEQMRQDADLLCQSLQQQMEQERKMALQQQQQLSRLLSEAESRIESAEESKKTAVAKVQAELNQTQQRQKRSVQMAEDKLAQALAKLDERDEEIRKLKTTVSTLQSKMTQHQEGAQEAEEEMDELHTENETLQQHVQVLQEECTSLRAHVEELEAEAEKYSGLEVRVAFCRNVATYWCNFIQFAFVRLAWLLVGGIEKDEGSLREGTCFDSVRCSKSGIKSCSSRIGTRRCYGGNEELAAAASRGIGRRECFQI